MSSIANLTINKNISVFCSGPSLLELTAEDIEYIKSKTFLITMNYAPIKYKGDMNIFCDKRVSDFLQKNIKCTEGILLFSRPQAFKNNWQDKEIKAKVNYWFDSSKDRLKGNYTLTFLLQLLQKYFNNKKIYLFGCDMDKAENGTEKWYDTVTKVDKESRGKHYDLKKKINDCGAQMRQHIKNINIFNCNMNSKFDYFPKIEWRKEFEK